MLRRALLALVVAMSGPNASMAACNDPQNQAEINQCAGDRFAAADRELNATYKDLAGRIDDAYKTELKVAQRAWIAFRDAECEFESMGWEGGTGRSAVQTACLQRVTAERTRLLEELLNCNPENYEGAIECPAKN